MAGQAGQEQKSESSVKTGQTRPVWLGLHAEAFAARCCAHAAAPSSRPKPQTRPHVHPPLQVQHHVRDCVALPTNPPVHHKAKTLHRHNPPLQVQHHVKRGGGSARPHELHAADGRVRQEHRRLQDRQAGAWDPHRHSLKEMKHTQLEPQWHHVGAPNPGSSRLRSKQCTRTGTIKLEPPWHLKWAHRIQEAEGGGQRVQEAVFCLHVRADACRWGAGRENGNSCAGGVRQRGTAILRLHVRKDACR